MSRIVGLVLSIRTLQGFEVAGAVEGAVADRGQAFACDGQARALASGARADAVLRVGDGAPPPAGPPASRFKLPPLFADGKPGQTVLSAAQPHCADYGLREKRGSHERT